MDIFGLHGKILGDYESYIRSFVNIKDLRRLHEHIDQAALTAYGWHIDTERWGPAIDLKHDFYEVDYLPENDRVRYTIHPDVRKEVLKRLLLLNHEYHEAEERGIEWEVVDEEKLIAALKTKVKGVFSQADELSPLATKAVYEAHNRIPTIEKSEVRSYRGFIAEYGAAVEYEYRARLFDAFNEVFQGEYPDEVSRSAFLAPEFSGKSSMFAGMLKKGQTKYTLGNIHFIVGLVCDPSGNTLASSNLLKKFRVFLLEHFDETFFTQDLVNKLIDFTKRRNKWVHPEEEDADPATKEEAMGFAEDARELMSVLLNSKKKNNV